jgi:hypothetical protein
MSGFGWKSGFTSTMERKADELAASDGVTITAQPPPGAPPVQLTTLAVAESESETDITISTRYCVAFSPGGRYAVAVGDADGRRIGWPEPVEKE